MQMTDLNPAEIEQTKLLSNAFDRGSKACITVGVVTPGDDAAQALSSMMRKPIIGGTAVPIRT
jgi:hypothetical protein